jgi:hypothetical protein
MAVTWWTNPAGEQRLVLDVFGRLDGYEDYECFAVEMTTELATQMLQRIERFRAWKAQDDQLTSIKFWNYNGEYFARDWDADDAEKPHDTEDNPAPVWERGDYDSRTEMATMEVGSDWAGWTAWAKHSDPAVKLSTESLDEADLRRFIAGENPWPLATVGPVGMQEG